MGQPGPSTSSRTSLKFTAVIDLRGRPGTEPGGSSLPQLKHCSLRFYDPVAKHHHNSNTADFQETSERPLAWEQRTTDQTEKVGPHGAACRCVTDSETG